MTHTNKLSRLMRMSWEIQKTKKNSRSRALAAAWAIMVNEDIAVWFLIRRLSPKRQITKKTFNEFSLFTV